MIATWPDRTTVIAWSSGPKFEVEVLGPAPSVAEITEQLVWVGAALRSSLQEDGVCYCTPYIKPLRKGDNSDLTYNASLTPKCHFQIGFKFDQGEDRKELINGQCWHDMFSNPVIVRGYPVARRTAT